MTAKDMTYATVSRRSVVITNI